MFADPAAARFAEEGIDWLLRAAFQHLRTQFGHRLSGEELLAAARRAVEGIRLDHSGHTWDTAAPCTVHQAQRVDRLRQGVRVLGTIVEGSDPQAVLVDAGDGTTMDTEAICIRISDAAGDQVWSLDVAGAPLLDKVHAACRSGRPTEFLAIPIALPVAITGSKPNLRLDESRRNFFLAVLDVRASASTLDLLGASGSERQLANDTIDGLVDHDENPLDYLVQQTIDIIGVSGLDRFPLLRELLRFTSIQALSCGHIDNASARLHAIIAGPPGRGKKLLGLAARIQNPTCAEMSPAKASPAGLVGASSNDGTGWKGTPGVLARAPEGVALLQDAHGWKRSLVNLLAPILQELMEDGLVRDSVAGGSTRQASCGLLIDLNRHSQVISGSSGEAAIISVRPVLSRADLLREIPADAEQAWAVGRAMVDRIGRGPSSFEADERVRQVRLVVAALRDRFPRIDLDPAREAMAGAFDAIQHANADVIQREPEAGDVPARLTITMARYVTALARGRASASASPGDVAEAVQFVAHKLRFLGLRVPGHGSPKPTMDDFVASRAGQHVRPADVARAYAAATGASACERTARRALRDAGAARLRTGVYLLPPRMADGQADSKEL